jgi:hypothetical protein
VHPDNVAVHILDPLATSDYFQEGVHYVPETEDFLAALGRLRENDHDLIARRCASPCLLSGADFKSLARQHAFALP